MTFANRRNIMSLETKYRKNLEQLKKTNEDATYEDLLNTFDTTIEKLYVVDQLIRENMADLALLRAIGDPDLFQSQCERIEGLWDVKKQIYNNYEITSEQQTND